MYPFIEPYETNHLDVGDGHKLFYELSGNPEGRPIVYLHGGPGSGSNPDMRRFFNPDHYKIIVFDQRGAGQSTPFARLQDNNMRNVIDDLERLRKHLGVKKWSMTGNSWGTALALLYSLDYAEYIESMILSGISFADMDGVKWLTEEGGASEIMPEWFFPYQNFIPEKDRKNGLYHAYYDIIANRSNEEEILEATKRFTMWDMALLKFDVPYDLIREVEEHPENYVALTRIFFHFVENDYSNDNKARIIEGVKKLDHIKCHIIHGRYDLICPVRNAFELHYAFPASQLHVLHATGHTTREPEIARKIVEITDSIAGIDNDPASYIRHMQRSK